MIYFELSRLVSILGIYRKLETTLKYKLLGAVLWGIDVTMRILVIDSLR
jgi:hypothetical protein